MRCSCAASETRAHAVALHLFGRTLTDVTFAKAPNLPRAILLPGALGKASPLALFLVIG